MLCHDPELIANARLADWGTAFLSTLATRGFQEGVPGTGTPIANRSRIGGLNKYF